MVETEKLEMGAGSFLIVLALNVGAVMVGTAESFAYVRMLDGSPASLGHQLLTALFIMHVFVLAPVLSMFLFYAFRTGKGPIKPFVRSLWYDRQLNAVAKLLAVIAAPILVAGLALNTVSITVLPAETPPPTYWAGVAAVSTAAAGTAIQRKYRRH